MQNSMINSFLERFKRTSTPKETEREEREKILALASEFDDLLSSPGWKKVVAYGANRVNDAIVAATANPHEPEIQRVSVIRWDAKRELLDSMLNYILDTHKQREDIRTLQRQ